MTLRLLALACASLALIACNAPGNASGQPASAQDDQSQAASPAAAEPATSNSRPFASPEIATFDQPWAMAFLPDGRLLVTAQRGAPKLVDVARRKVGDLTGATEVASGGHGGSGGTAPARER